MKTPYGLQVPPCLISTWFWLFTPILAPDRAQAEARELCSFPQPDTRGPPFLPPSLLAWSWKKAQIRAARVGARQGRKERWMERKEKMAKDLGDIFKAHMLRLSSTFSGEGWWMWRGCVCVESGVRIGCKGTGDTFVSPVCQLREGGGDQGGAVLIV